MFATAVIVSMLAIVLVPAIEAGINEAARLEEELSQ